MLKKNLRLGQRDFASVFRQGRSFQYPSFIVKYKKNGLEYSRFGVSIGLKFSKKAVIRNAVKRTLYRLVRDYFFPQQGAPQRPCCADYIFIIRPQKAPQVLDEFLALLENDFAAFIHEIDK